MSDYDYDDPLFSNEELKEQLAKELEGGGVDASFGSTVNSLTQTIGALLVDNGLPEDYQILIDISQAQPENLRGKFFSNLEDAINWLAEIGVLAISNIVEFLDENDEPYFDVSIPDSSERSPTVGIL